MRLVEAGGGGAVEVRWEDRGRRRKQIYGIKVGAAVTERKVVDVEQRWGGGRAEEGQWGERGV